MVIDNPTTSGPGVDPTPQPDTTPIVPAANPQWPLLLAISLLGVAAMGAVAAVAYNGGEASTPVVISIFGFATATIASVLGLIKASQVGTQMAALHVDVNSRLSQLISSASAAANAEGQLQGQSDQREVAATATMARAVALAILEEQRHRDALDDLAHPQIPREVVIVAAHEPVPIVVAEPPVPVAVVKDEEGEGA